MKICVSAIAKNEQEFCARFMRTASEADGVYVLDTGSTDDTATILHDLGAHVLECTYEQFRFDVARNDALKMIPYDCDVCVVIDLDEVLTVGWRKMIEDAWTLGVTDQASYTYVWSFNADGSDGLTYSHERIFNPAKFRWKYPVHETLQYLGNNIKNRIHINNLRFEHYPRPNKFTYETLELLELAYAEDPNSDRIQHYLGRELMFNGRYPEAINMLRKHLANHAATWVEERAASMRFIGRCWHELTYYYDALLWFQRAVSEAPLERDGWYEAAKQAFRNEDRIAFDYFARGALNITERTNMYMTEAEAWSGELEQMVIEMSKI